MKWLRPSSICVLAGLAILAVWGAGCGSKSAVPPIFHPHTASEGIDASRTPSATRLFTIPAAGAAYLAFDPSGNLYATTNTGTLLLFPAPLSATGTPLVTLNQQTANTAVGIAIGE